MKFIFILTLIVSHVEAEAKATLGDFIRLPNSREIQLIGSPYEAELECCKLNKVKNCEELTREEKFKLKIRIPTGRELAMHAITFCRQKSTAKCPVILEDSEYNEGDIPKHIKDLGFTKYDFYYYGLINPDGTRDTFYYSPGYFKTSEKIEEQSIWSGSCFAHMPGGPCSLYHASLYYGDGEIGNHYRNSGKDGANSVRCISQR